MCIFQRINIQEEATLFVLGLFNNKLVHERNADMNNELSSWSDVFIYPGVTKIRQDFVLLILKDAPISKSPEMWGFSHLANG